MGVHRQQVRAAAGVATLAAVCWWVGPRHVLDVLHVLTRIDAWSLVLVAAIGLVSTTCAAWRWVLVSRAFGLTLSLREAVMASYQSQFLNLSLPGGVLGDVRRAVRQGDEAGDRGRAARAVVWERTSGQLVQVGLTALALLLLGSVFAPGPSLTAAGVVVALALLVAAARWPGVVLASVVAVAGYVVTFLVAARTAGTTLAPTTLVPIALVVLTAMAIPLNVAGWGPREGVAAWAFALAGPGADRGLATAVAYGGFALVASLPGAVLLAVARRNWRREPSPAAYPVVVVGGVDA